MPGEPFVQTVLGPTEPDQLGWTLMHEHFMIDWTHGLHVPCRPLESSSALQRALDWAGRARQAGIRTIVDAGMDVYGPSPTALLYVSRQSGLNVVATTGIFETAQLPPPHWALPPATDESVCEHFTDVAVSGLFGSGVRPGVLKVATSPRAITEIEETCLRGAALAQARLGLPIMTHTRAPETMETQADILLEAGADPAKVSIGHVGWMSGREDMPRFKRLASRGVFLGLDCIGSPARSLREYAAILTDLLEAGYGSQLLLSHDSVAYVRGIEGVYEREWFTTTFTVIAEQFLPLLRDEFDVDEGTITRMTVDNPRRLLTIDPGPNPEVREALRSEPRDDYSAWLAGEAV